MHWPTFIFMLLLPIPIAFVLGGFIFTSIEVHDRSDHLRRSLGDKMSKRPRATLFTEGDEAFIKIDAPLTDTRLNEKEAELLINEIREALLKMKSVRILLNLEAGETA